MAQHSIHKFVLGNKELEGKIAEFQYDRGVYTITDIVGEERSVVYKSRNAQEAYMKWNVYIGRKKERPQREINRRDNDRDPSAGKAEASDMTAAKMIPLLTWKRQSIRKKRKARTKDSAVRKNTNKRISVSDIIKDNTTANKRKDLLRKRIKTRIGTVAKNRM